MEYLRFVTRAFTISDQQDKWLIQQAEKRLSNKSMIVREAIQLLQTLKVDNSATTNTIKEKDDEI